jgi:hypothetical protein
MTPTYKPTPRRTIETLPVPPNWPSNAPPSGPDNIAPDDVETALDIVAAADPNVRQIDPNAICPRCGRGG